MPESGGIVPNKTKHCDGHSGDTHKKRIMHGLYSESVCYLIVQWNTCILKKCKNNIRYIQINGINEKCYKNVDRKWLLNLEAIKRDVTEAVEHILGLNIWKRFI